MSAIGAMSFAKKLLKLETSETTSNNLVTNLKSGVAEAIQPVDIVSFSGARTDRAVEMIQRASETSEIRDDSMLTTALNSENITTTVTSNTSAVTQNTVIIPDSPFDKQFQASSGAF